MYFPIKRSRLDQNWTIPFGLIVHRVLQYVLESLGGFLVCPARCLCASLPLRFDVFDAEQGGQLTDQSTITVRVRESAVSEYAKK